MKKVNYRFFILFLFSSLLMLSTSVLAVKPVPFCGDGKCQGDETAETCDLDCAVCGDGLCTGDETYAVCPADCEPPPPPLCNNDGTCNEGEDCLSCPNDCPGETGGKPSNRFCCGADTCNELLCGGGCGPPINESI